MPPVSGFAAFCSARRRSVVVPADLSLRLRGGPGAAALARRELSRLDSDLEPTLADTVYLLVTELVSNAVKHAAADPVSVNVSVDHKAVRAEVTDPGPGFDPDGAGSPRDNHTGWGLFLVEQLAHRWGVAEDGKATRVWFELRAA